MQPRAVIAEALQLLRSGKADAAADKLKRALARAPDADISHALGQVLLSSGKPDQALFHFERAAKASPARADYQFGLGAACFTLGQMPQAAAALSETVRLDPSLGGAWVSLAAVLPIVGDPDGALVAARRGIALLPDEPTALENHARAAGKCGLADEALQSTSRLTAASPTNWTTRSFHLMMLNYPSSIGEDRVQAEHRAIGRDLRTTLGAARPDAAFRNSRDPDRPLRIGFLSSDLYRHSVPAFLEPILEHIDRNAFEVTCCHTSPHEDAVTARLKALSTNWVDAAALSDEAIDARIAADSVDILIDLNGHSAGARMGVLARRPAPILATFIGYANTTGLDVINCRFIDDITDPAGSDHLATEELIRLPGCFLCYKPDVEAPEPEPAPPRPPTFGSFNTALKISERTAALWSAVLAAVPGSRLVLKSPTFAAAASKDHLQALFASRGIGSDRIDFLPPALTAREHLSQYRLMDVALDPAPYNGTTTTCEALWMGVPVVTLTGDTHRARVGTSLLKAADCADWIARDDAGFTRIAAALSSSAPDRAALRERTRASRLCNARSFVRSFEQALRARWQRWCSAK